ncbi:MAG: hypothetical protein K2I90_06675, partial [Odoribacter sp.]|nr:hypothetical protein [Odoribacter sp.]
MKNIKYAGWLLLFFLWGCVDDDSRYGDVDIDEITIEGIEDYREIELGGKLIVTPTVKTKFGEKSDLSYVWYKYNSQQRVADTLSFEKNLEVVIADVLPGEDITLSFKVTDNQTGVYKLHNSKFKTVGVYAGGTLMLCQTDGQCDLSMLKKDGTTFYENIYSLANKGEKLSHKAKRLFLTHPYANNPLPYKAVIVACDDETGGVYLDIDALLRKAYMREKFMFPEDMSGDLVITGIYNGQSIEYMIVNGKVYGRSFSRSAEDATWESEYVIMAEPSNYEMAAFAAQPFDKAMWGGKYYGAPIFYDNLHGRFMVNASGGYLSFLGGGLLDNFSQFNPSNMGEGLQLIATGCMDADLNKVWALLKKPATGEHVLIKYELVMDEDWNDGFVALSKQTIPQSSCPGMYMAEVFVPGNKYSISTLDMWNQKVNGLSNLLLYVANNKVYAFNTQSHSEGVLIDGAQEGYAITGLDCTEVAWPTTEQPDATITQLTLAVKDQKQSGKQGGNAVYKLN